MLNQTLKTWILRNKLTKAKVNEMYILEFLTGEAGDYTDDDTLKVLVEDVRNGDFNVSLEMNKTRHQKTWDKEIKIALYMLSTENETIVPEITPPEPTVIQPVVNLLPNKCQYIRLLVRLPQSGKTRIMLKECVKFIASKKPNISGIYRPINIIIGDNNTILNNQTKTRTAECNDFRTAKITCYSSSKDESSFKNAKKVTSTTESLKQQLLDGTYNIVVMCGNKSRFDDVKYLIRELSDSRACACFFNIYIDEADKIVNAASRKDLVTQWHTHERVVKTTLITATPIKVPRQFKKLTEWIGSYFGDKMMLVMLSEKWGKGYHRLSDSKHVAWEEPVAELDPETGRKKKQIDAFVDYLDDFFRHNSAKTGEVWLMPGMSSTTSHDIMVEHCMEELPEESNNIIKKCQKTDGASEPRFNAILLLNGKLKQFHIWNYYTKKWDIRRCKEIKDYDNLEMQKWLADIYNEHDGSKKWRLAITGNKCIGRGLTISSKTCNITHGVFPSFCTSNISSYFQLVSRVCGYTRENGAVPTVITSTDMWRKFNMYEKCINELMELTLSGDGIVSTDTVNSLVSKVIIACDETYTPSDWEHEWIEVNAGKYGTDRYKSALCKVDKWIKDHGHRGGKRKPKIQDEFVLSSYTGKCEVLNYERMKKVMEDIDSDILRKTQNLDKKGSRKYITYKDANDPESVVIIARSLQHTSKD